ncbi:phosphohydrolase [Candidatus Desantisbacteria bacterium CG_4_10_14_0_8_um_filter_48_22]|uniref:Phosphohydrolase n=1 Tax=Candidatus Desantisbacteria bacterium CG_4_10_14_0_8_um_filter_48_22 TaxID=1974543 RepID=A0A2M7SEP7_9BACT|nr:MAG: phosphohydrolase [Candidatus Desantisbacteria bacterium CG02_land_8_20_14_3_00_49_13]PIZ18007.1 MAG: phosphohydrolase [Candidatus Desantisbacteria bacterium CG_4_10_14_0_8_um_filter_48_22]
MGKCPGQDTRNLKAALYKCPNCGYDAEIFSDELKVRCRKCGKYVYREKAPSCIDWCPAAKECIGIEKWKELTGRSGK